MAAWNMVGVFWRNSQKRVSWMRLRAPAECRFRYGTESDTDRPDAEWSIFYTYNRFQMLNSLVS